MICNQGHSFWLLTSLSEEETCRKLRAALRMQGLEVAEQIDLSKEIAKHIGLSVSKYFILSVWSPLATYQALLAIPEAGLFVPFHVAVTSRNGRTLVMVVNPDWLARVVDRIGFRLLAKDLSGRLSRALQTLEPIETSQEELEGRMVAAELQTR